MNKQRGYNFGSGPATLPKAILQEAQTELLDWQGLDMSVMEIGHRTPEFTRLMEDTEQKLRDLLTIPDNYHVLFLGGAARIQFAMIPMNLLASGQEAGYILTGSWSVLAYQEAVKIKQAYCLASTESTKFTSLPDSQNWNIKPDSAYIYFTPNETIHGVRIAAPNVGRIPLIADMTSCLLSEPLDVTQYDLIFAGSQKNIANAGLTIVIIKDNLLKTINDPHLPTMFDYRTFTTTRSMYATPPSFNCYMANKMFAWIKDQGGVEAFYKINCQKAKRLYDYIDASSFYKCPVDINARSIMNICFFLKNPALETEFLTKSKAQGLYALKGHMQVGGLRASIYNAMPIEGIDLLISFMEVFAKEHS